MKYKAMRKSITFTLLIVSIIAQSQVTNYNLPPKTFYKKVNVTLKDFTKYECKSVNINTETISFINLNTNLNESLALTKINYLRVQNGNQALKWSGLGALLMGLTAALNVFEYPDTQNSGGLIVGFTLSGAVIGGLIGLAIPRWKTYYLNFK